MAFILSLLLYICFTTNDLTFVLLDMLPFLGAKELMEVESIDRCFRAKVFAIANDVEKFEYLGMSLFWDQLQTYPRETPIFRNKQTGEIRYNFHISESKKQALSSSTGIDTNQIHSGDKIVGDTRAIILKNGDLQVYAQDEGWAHNRQSVEGLKCSFVCTASWCSLGIWDKTGVLHFVGLHSAGWIENSIREAKMVFSARLYFVVLMKDGSLRCRGAHREMEQASASLSKFDHHVGRFGVKQVVANKCTVASLLNDGTVYFWGDGDNDWNYDEEMEYPIWKDIQKIALTEGPAYKFVGFGKTGVQSWPAASEMEIENAFRNTIFQ